MQLHYVLKGIQSSVLRNSQGTWQQSRAPCGAQLQCTGPIKKYCCALAELINNNIATSETVQDNEPT